MHRTWDVEGFLEAMDRSFENFHIEAISKAEQYEESIVVVCSIRGRDEPVPPTDIATQVAVRWVEEANLLSFTRCVGTGLPPAAWGWVLYRLSEHHLADNGSLVRAALLDPEPEEKLTTLHLDCNWSIVFRPPISSELEHALRDSLERFYSETCLLAELLSDDWERMLLT